MKFKTILSSIVISALMISAGIDLNNLENYASQVKPAYINKDNCPTANPVSNKGATLGRVLFYDKKLSVNNSVACASCHQQQFAFGDTASLSVGVTSTLTTRHAMRLINSRFAAEVKFFWDERATSLEDQASMPIKNHNEMGYSGLNGDPSINDLIVKLGQVPYYSTLFSYVYGDAAITETRIQLALAQFIRSIQSFDSKFDAGLAQSGNLNAPFANYSALENQGKQLFLAPPPAGGAGCQGCHRAPEFDIDPNTKNNGVIASASNPNVNDLTNTRAPSLRDLFNPSGSLNGPLMHNGKFSTIDAVINHYNSIPINPANTNLDPRLIGPGGNLQLTQIQKNALIAFLRTLSGTSVYTDPKWSSPFDANGNLMGTLTSVLKHQSPVFRLYPNPVSDYLVIEIEPGNYSLDVVNENGQAILSKKMNGSEKLPLESLEKGLYFIRLTDETTQVSALQKIIRN